MTREADRRWSKASSGSNGDRRRLGRFRPEEAGLGVGEGGGGAGEGARMRNRGMVAGGGRSKEGTTAARADELRSSLVEVRKRKEEEMTGRSYIQINIWVLPERTVRRSLVDCPRGWMLQSFPLKEISSRDFNGDAEI